MVEPFNNSFENYPGYKLKIASTFVISDLSKAIAPFGLTVTEATILLFVDGNPGCLQAELGKTLRMASANLTPLASKLEARELIRREPIDGRSNGLHLTKTGRSLTRDVNKVMVDFEAQVIAKIPDHLRDPFLEALDYLIPAK